MRSFADGVIKYIKTTDIILWLLSIGASVYGLLLINSMQRAGNYSYMRSQLIAVIIGIVLAVVISLIDCEYITKAWWIFALLSLLMIGLVFLMGIQVAGTDDTAWISLPGGFTIQPSEFVKLFFIITLAKHISILRENGMIKNVMGVLTLLFHAAVPVVLIHLQGDDGAVLIFLFIFIVMTFVGGVQLRYYILALCCAVVAIPLIWTFFLNDEHRNRIMALFDIDKNALTDYGWQQYQGKVSIASGGLDGYGLGEGPRVETGIVPEQENDFIFTVAGEELGFIGCALILLILLFICLKIAVNAHTSKNKTGSLISYGVFALISSQTIINIGMVLGFLPVVGITLPFFSSGGTSVLCMFLAIGLCQSVYMHDKPPVDEDKVKLKGKYKIRNDWV